jgi:hypothetical protein
MMRISRAVRLGVATIALAGAIPCLIGFGCGGTTGREGLSDGAGNGEAGLGADATIGNDGGSEASAPGAFDAGTFDVIIQYADRDLPDVGAPQPVAEGGSDSGWPWPFPNCPPFLSGDGNGNPIPTYDDLQLLPSDYDAGKIVPAVDGSTCGTHVWLDNSGDQWCIDQNPSGGLALFPPCNWCVDAGVATSGSGATRPLYDLCLELYACIARTGCDVFTDALHHPALCLCGATFDVNSCTPTGPCAKEELAAFQAPELPSPQDIHQVIGNYNATRIGTGVSCAGQLNQVYNLAHSVIPKQCNPDAGKD